MSFAVVRAYQSTGRPDPAAAQSIKNARAAGIAYVDAYMFPCAKCGASASTQVSDCVNNLRNNGANFGMLWFDIEGSQYWRDQNFNRNWMTEALSKASSMGVKIGVYTSASQWGPIMGLSWSGASHYPLWYAHYDNSQSFSDFSAFGGWGRPAIKQYAGDASRCGVGVDLNWYP